MMKNSVTYSPLAMLCIFAMMTGLAGCNSKDASSTSKGIPPDVIVERVKAMPFPMTSYLPERMVASLIAEIRRRFQKLCYPVISQNVNVLNQYPAIPE